ncbi:hypothetical protein Zmor_017323 [Zophobas morio]|uniref:DUF659 domain-containing protein n=1 Tax=Zophobas morio TaxID=2755281 RepID=A0AA38I8S4_9CUCU|nr:hypothetical protein Zmor_017323 [Zophobas morio]
MHKYIRRHLPSETTLRKNYLPKDYDMVIKQIRNCIDNNNIRISVDETTDRLGRYIAHLVTGNLSSEEAGRPFLLALKQLDKTNSNTISRFINDSLALLWPKGTEHKKVKWFVSDGASYMIKTGLEEERKKPKGIETHLKAMDLNGNRVDRKELIAASIGRSDNWSQSQLIATQIRRKYKYN